MLYTVDQRSIIVAGSATLPNEVTAGILPSVEEIAPGIICEWLHNRAIAAYVVRNVARTSVDAWLRHIKKRMMDWPLNRPYLVLQDLCDPNVGPTPYVRERTQEIGTWRPELSTHVALILPRTFQGQLIQFFVQARRDPVARIFFSRTEGLAWLQSYLSVSSTRL
jgi:hypothetical protein